MMEIIRQGLIITPTGSLEPSQGSYDVPVKLINDDTYQDHTIDMYVGYYLSGALKKRKCSTDSEGNYLIPRVAFQQNGMISISFLLETADKSTGLMTNSLSYEVKHAPNVVVEVPADPSWQELVKEWIKEVSGTVVVDATLTQSGKAADAKVVGERLRQLSDSIDDMKQNGTGGSASGTGWTSSQITLLETIGEYIVFKNESTGQAIFDNLIASLRNGSGSDEPDTPVEPDIPDVPEEPTVKTYSITNSLTNATTDNNVSSVEENASYTANLTASDGYYLGEVIVTMGGTDVTSTVYSDGVINIAQVTGNVVIVANGMQSDNLIVISECALGGSGNDGTAYSTDYYITPYYQVTEGETYYTNITRYIDETNQDYKQKIFFVDSDNKLIKTTQITTGNAMGIMRTYSVPTGATKCRIGFHKNYGDIAYFGKSGVNL